MRWSKFVNFYDVDDKVILFNSVTRAVSKMDMKDLKKIKDYVRGEDANNPSDEMKEAISELYIDQFIVADDFSEKEAVYTLRHDRDKQNSIVMYFIPTFNCNFRCPYCIVSSTDHDCENPDNIISDEDAIYSAEWLAEHAVKNNIKKVTVELFGGEPMLGHKQNMIFLRTLNKLKEHGIDLKYNMISNGYLLSDEKLSELKEVGLETIQFTVDGPQKINDKRRILSNGQGSFEKIIENIQKCRKHNIFASIRINIDEENAHYIVELINYLAELELQEFVTIGIAPVDPPLDNFSISGHTKDTMRYIPEIYNSINVHNFRSVMWETFCGLGTKNFFVICPDGDLYNCPSYAGIKEYSVGNIHTGGFDTTRPGMHEIPERCNTCSLVGICSGGCYLVKEQHNLGDGYCLKPTHSVMAKSFLTSKYE